MINTKFSGFTEIGKSFLVFADIDIGQPSVEIGDKVSIEQRFSLLSGAPITIGSNTIIASDVLITSQNHGIDPERTESYSATDLQVKAVFIGKGCWIGEKCSILPGVELGNRVIVAAGSVVTKSFPDACMVAGVPAKIIKKYNWTNHTWEKV